MIEDETKSRVISLPEYNSHSRKNSCSEKDTVQEIKEISIRNLLGNKINLKIIMEKFCKMIHYVVHGCEHYTKLNYIL